MGDDEEDDNEEDEDNEQGEGRRGGRRRGDEEEEDDNEEKDNKEEDERWSLYYLRVFKHRHDLLVPVPPFVLRSNERHMVSSSDYNFCRWRRTRRRTRTRTTTAMTRRTTTRISVPLTALFLNAAWE